jgi:hypothetical protein
MSAAVRSNWPDVHTDGNMEEVLEVESGYIDWLLVVNRLVDATLGATVNLRAGTYADQVIEPEAAWTGR